MSDENVEIEVIETKPDEGMVEINIAVGPRCTDMPLKRADAKKLYEKLKEIFEPKLKESFFNELRRTAPRPRPVERVPYPVPHPVPYPVPYPAPTPNYPPTPWKIYMTTAAEI